jgi:hypothetical protein
VSGGGFVNAPHDDYAAEPIPGLPAELPEGERLLWQGSPGWRSLAIRAFHVRKVAVYFAVLMAWRLASSASDGASAFEAVSYAVGLAPLALAAICILVLLAYAYARMTIYSITSKRVMIRSGVAMPITVNLPFKRIDGAGLKLHADGTGDIPLMLSKDDRVAILAIWPNMRPWKISKPEPMLRSLPDASGVADILAAALSGARIPAMRSEPASAQPSAQGAGTVSQMLRPVH